MLLPDITVDLNALTSGKSLPADQPQADDMDMQMALAQARDLQARASMTLNAAYANIAEAPEDVNDAAAAVVLATATLARINELAKDKTRGNEARGIVNSLLSSTSASVNIASAEVEAHDAETSSDVAKRTAHEASIHEKSKKANGKAAGPKSLPKPKTRSDSDDGSPADRARAAFIKRQRGENDDNDERDDEVGKGKKRRVRKATSGTGRQVTRVLSGLMDEDKADEVVSTVGTAYTTGTDGAAAIARGDVRGSDKAALGWGRGVRNVIRDDLGMDGDLAQGVGRATTVTLQTAGRAGSAVVNTADDVRDAAADKYQLMWQYGRELNQLLGGLQANAKTRAMYDTDKDGKVELHEVVGKLKSYGISDIKNIDFNGDSNITYAEIGAAIKARGQKPAK